MRVKDIYRELAALHVIYIQNGGTDQEFGNLRIRSKRDQYATVNLHLKLKDRETFPKEVRKMMFSPTRDETVNRRMQRQILTMTRSTKNFIEINVKIGTSDHTKVREIQ